MSMDHIHKKILTDEQNNPIAVQIDYADWLQIERVLSSAEQPKATELHRFIGTLDWGEDGVEYQRRVREEWGS